MSLQNLYKKVYFYMGLAILISSIVGIILVNILPRSIIFSPIFLFGSLILSIISIFIIFKNNRLNQVSYLIFALINGILYTNIFVSKMFIPAFIVSSIALILLTIVGSIIKVDLSKWSKIGIYLLIGIILLSLVKVIFHLTILSMLISMLSLFVFGFYIIYDSQNVKKAYNQFHGNVPEYIVLMLSINIYITFMNLFSIITDLLDN